MRTIFVTALSDITGKTMLSAGLAKTWQNSGRKAGYLKLVESGDAASDSDMIFVQKVLGFSPENPATDPVVNSQTSQLKDVLSKMAQEKDIVIVEGTLAAVSRSVKTLEGHVLVVHSYVNQLTESLAEYKKLGDRLLGLIITKVPSGKLKQFTESVTPEISQAGLNLLGIIPEERILATMSVTDIAEAVEGKILNNEDSAGELIENVMLGSSTFDRGAAYYNRKKNKAVLLWGDRLGFRKAVVSNYQLSALQTSTRCIVISAGVPPLPAVTQKAEELKVPLISTQLPLPELVKKIEDAMTGLKFHQEKKLPRLLEVLPATIKMAQIEEKIGLSG